VPLQTKREPKDELQQALHCLLAISGSSDDVSSSQDLTLLFCRRRLNMVPVVLLERAVGETVSRATFPSDPPATMARERTV
jgi:hypothetical protein